MAVFNGSTEVRFRNLLPIPSDRLRYLRTWFWLKHRNERSLPRRRTVEIETGLCAKSPENGNFHSQAGDFWQFLAEIAISPDAETPSRMR
jgi:hypothetical protein